jgi:ketosteroid isomerase-like protein
VELARRGHAVGLNRRSLVAVAYARLVPSLTPERLRAAYDRFYAGQADAHVEFMAPDVVAVDHSGAPDAGTHDGLDAYLAWAQDFLDLFSEIEVERLEIEEHPGDRLLVLIHLRVVTLAGGMPVNLTIGHLLQLRVGAIVSIDAFIDEQLAREFV